MQNLLEFQAGNYLLTPTTESSSIGGLFGIYGEAAAHRELLCTLARRRGTEEEETITHIMKYYASSMIKVFATTNYRSFASLFCFSNKQRLSSHSTLSPLSRLNIITQAINIPDEHSAASHFVAPSEVETVVA